MAAFFISLSAVKNEIEKMLSFKPLNILLQSLYKLHAHAVNVCYGYSVRSCLLITLRFKCLEMVFIFVCCLSVIFIAFCCVL